MGRKINIRPTTSVYATYKNINYEIWTAIAEFVDNSTQSYYDNKKALQQSKYWDKCVIQVNYGKDEEDNYYLEIRDNAFGMDFNDFQRAIILDSPPRIASRSEFGMGLKTAACWFGRKWSVESVALGSGVKYRTVVDVDLLSKYKYEEIEVEEIKCNPKEHGTVIRIWDMNRSIRGRSVGKTKDMLRGMYRVDLRSGEVELYYNDEKLYFNDPEVYEEISEDGSLIRWENKDINFSIENNNKIYHVTGTIAIRKVASVAEAGFTLIRRGRVIIGGYENNYRPEEIFGKSNSFEYQRLFGELNLDDWPVVQTKDNFDWNNGLEDLLIDKLKEISKEYILKARKIRKRKVIDGALIIDNMVASFEKAGVISNPIVENYIEHNSNNIAFNERNEISEFGSDEENHVIINHNEARTITFKIGVTEYKFNLIIDDINVNEEWLKILSDPENDTYTIKWNVKHPFFKTLSNEPEFVSKMQSFIFGFAIAEVQSLKFGQDGLIEPSAIRKSMNTILKNIGGE